MYPLEAGKATRCNYMQGFSKACRAWNLKPWRHLEGQGDLVGIRITPIGEVINPIFSVINLLTKSPCSLQEGRTRPIYP